MALNDPDVSPDEADDAAQDMSFADLKAWVKAALDARSGWYKEAREAYDFVAGRQWDEDEEQAFKGTNRPPIKFNLVGPTINAVCGMEVNNRQEVKFLPRTQGDAQVNERLTDLADWARQECQAEDEESAAFRDNVICGCGATETRLDFEEEPTGKIVVDRRDPLDCFVDPAASKANFADRKFGGEFRDLDTDEAEAMFPGVSWAALNATWARAIDLHDGGEGNKRDYPDETRPGLRDGQRPKSVRVVRIQWWERARAYMVAMPDGQPRQIGADEFERGKAALEAAGQPVPPAQAVWVRRYRQAFLGSGTILPNPEGETIEDIDGFSLAFMTGTWDRNKRYHYGLVRPLLDPQRIVNKSLVQTHQILNTNAKGGLLMEKGAFSNPRDAEKDWSDPSKTIIMADGAISGNRIKERTAPPLPPALTSLLELAMSSIRNVTGVNLEILGAADRDQAASLEYQRRQSAMSILAPLFDAFRRYRKTQGYILIDCLRRLPPGVLVRVVQDEDMPAPQAGAQPQMAPGAPQQPQPGQNPPQQAPGQPQRAFQPFDPAYFGLDKEGDRFDVIVDEAPSSPNQKDQTWSALQPFLAGLASNPAAIAVALKYSPLPLAAAQELAEAMTGNGLPPEVQQQMQQGRQLIEQLTQENTQLKGDRSIEAAKVQSRAQADAAKAQTEQFNAQTDRIHKVGQLGGNEGHGGDQVELLKLQMQQQFDAMEAARKRDHEVLLQHLKNAGQIAASRVRADAGADANIETDNEVGV